MGQQPNVELEPADRPRPVLEPGPPRRWDPRDKAGVIVSPDQVPRGPSFGTPGPDTGYALRLIRLAGAAEPGDELEAILVALISARSGALGRAPIGEDLEAAMLLAGLGDGLPGWLEERRSRWIEAAAHEVSRGRAALADVDPELLVEHPDRIRQALAGG